MDRNKKIFVLGSLNMDLVISSDKVPKAGETLMGTGFASFPGGKGANQAVAAARLGGKVFLYGCVGNDVFGKSLIENCQKNHVDTNYIDIIQESNTGIAMITLVEGDNRILLYSGANYQLSKERVDHFLANANEGDILLAQMEVPVEIIKYGIHQAKSKGMKVLFNPAPASLECLSFLEYVDFLIVNETEVTLLGNTDDIEVACKSLMDLGLKQIVVTLGGKGYFYIDEQTKYYAPAYKVEVVDTTGAGDAFCGALSVGLSRNMRVVEALKMASLTGTMSVQKLGAQSSYPTLDELKAFAKTLV